MPGASVFNWGWQRELGRWLEVRVSPDGRLLVMAETALDSGVATGGTNTTLEDTTKDWEVDMWVDAIIEVVIGGIEYHRTVTGNTNDTKTFNALPVGVAVVAGCSYATR